MASDGLLGQLAGSNDTILAALQTILRNVYAHGRSARAVVAAVMRIAASSDAPVAYRALAYEILWTVVANSDVLAYRAIAALARNDMASSDHPDLSMTALATLASLPAYLYSDIFGSDGGGGGGGSGGVEVERTMVDAMTGDAPTYVRCASVSTFARIAYRTIMQCASHATDATSVRGYGLVPADSLALLQRRSQRITDKCMEVLRGVCRVTEDADFEVASAAFGALRNVLDTAPALTLTAAGAANGAPADANNFALAAAGSGTGSGAPFTTSVSPLASRYAGVGGSGALPLPGPWGGANAAASGPAGVAHNAGAATAALVVGVLRPAHAALSREVCRRLLPRFTLLAARMHSLRPRGRAHAVRTLTLVLAIAAADGVGGKTGPLDVPASVRLDTGAPWGDPSIHNLLHEWMAVHLPRVFGGRGGGTAAGAAGAGALGGPGSGHWHHASTPHVPLNEEANGASAAAPALEAARAWVQLAMTWGPALASPAVGARIHAGRTGAADLLAVSVPGSHIPLHGGPGGVHGVATQALATAAATGGLNTGTPSSRLSVEGASMMETGPAGGNDTLLALAGDAAASTFAGSLWPLLASSPPPVHTAAATPVTAAVGAAFGRGVAPVLSFLFAFLRRVHTVAQAAAQSAGPVVATAGVLPGGGHSSLLNTALTGAAVAISPAEAAALGLPSSSSSSAGAAAGGAGSVGPSGAPLNPNDPAVLAAAGAVVSAGWGLGTGGGSALITDSMLHRLLLLTINVLSSAPPATLLALAPAVIREIGRLADDVIDDVGAGTNHNGRRTGLLMYVWSLITHAVLVEGAPRGALGPYVSEGMAGMGAAGGDGSLPVSGAAGGQGRAGSADAGASRGGGGGGGATPLPSNTGATRPASSPAAPSSSSASAASQAALMPGVPHSLLLPRVAFEATRPLAVGFGGDASSSPPSVLAAVAGLSAAGDLHAAETAAVSTRFRAEVGGVMLQCIARASPSLPVLTRLQDVARGTDAPHPAVVPSRIADAEALHVWLCVAGDALAAYAWLCDHRLTYGGVGTMSRDQAAATLARIMGQPDAPAPAPAPIPHAAPASLYAGEDGGLALLGSGGSAAAAAGSRTSVSSAGSSAGVGYVTGWAWAREYEAVVEASEAWTNLLLSMAAFLHPPALATTYGAVTASGATSPGTALSTALAVDLLPPALLALHRTRLSRLFYAISKLDCGVYRMYELERAAQAMAPKVAAQAAAAASQHSITASVTRGSTYDVLPSAVPLQLRLLWVLTGAWDGTDGVTSASSAGAAAAGAAADAPSGSPGIATLIAPLPSTSTSMHHHHGSGGVGGGAATVHGGMTVMSAASSIVPGGYHGSGGIGPGVTVSGLAISATDALLRNSALAPTSLQLTLREVLSKAGTGSGAAGSSAAGRGGPYGYRGAYAGGHGSSSRHVRGGTSRSFGASGASVSGRGGSEKAMVGGVSGGKGLLALALTAEETAALTVEALRQKRLAALAGLVSGEAGVALGLGTDLEGAGYRALAVLVALEAGSAPPSYASAGSTGGVTPTGSVASYASTPMGAGASAADAAGASSAAATPASTSSSSSWLRGTKIGRALGFFGGSGKKDTGIAGGHSIASVVSAPSVYSGEGTMVTYAHFWLLIDMLAHLAASQRCIAGFVRRSIECMLVQPKLAPEVGATLTALLPRLALFAAAYGRSSVAKELAVLDTGDTDDIALPPPPPSGASDEPLSTLGSAIVALRSATTSSGILCAVAAEAALCAADPWSFTHYNPRRTIGLNGAIVDASADPLTAAALTQLADYKKLIVVGGDAAAGAAPAAASTAAASSASPTLNAFGLAGLSFDAPSAPASSSGKAAGTTAPSSGSGVSACEILADMLSPPTLALIAAASAPDLTQNATLGLNRSAASGARMRTVAPFASAHAQDAAAVAASFALARRTTASAPWEWSAPDASTSSSGASSSLTASGKPSSGVVVPTTQHTHYKAALSLPSAFIGSVPRDLGPAFRDAQMRLKEIEGELRREDGDRSPLPSALSSSSSASPGGVGSGSAAAASALERLYASLPQRVAAAIALGAASQVRLRRLLDSFVVPHRALCGQGAAEDEAREAMALAMAAPLPPQLLLELLAGDAGSSGGTDVDAALVSLQPEHALTIRALASGGSHGSAGGAGAGASPYGYGDPLLRQSLSLPPAVAALNSLSYAPLALAVERQSALFAARQGNAGPVDPAVGLPLPTAPLLSLAHTAAADGIVLTGSNDPVTVAMSHTVHPHMSRITLHVRLTNDTRIRLPAGSVRLSLRLAGPLMFDRATITSAHVASSSSRLGSSAVGNAAAPGTGMGAASAGGALTGDGPLLMQRGSSSHVTHTITKPLPPGFVLSYDVTVSVVGFGSASVRAAVIFECADLLTSQHSLLNAAAAGAGLSPAEAQEAAAAVTASLPGPAALAVRAGRAIGVNASEDMTMDDDEEVDWDRVGATSAHAGGDGFSGAVTGAWGYDLAPPTLTPNGDGLIWSGPELSMPKRGKLLGGAITPQLSISRMSANRPPHTVSGSSLGGGLPAGVSALSTTSAGGRGAGGSGASVSGGGDIVMREWSSRDRGPPSMAASGIAGIMSSSSMRDRRPSGASSHFGGASRPGGGVAGSPGGMGRDSADADSDFGGGGGGDGTVHDDDAGSVGSSATAAAMAAAAAGPVEIDLDATGAASNAAVRPFRARRLEITTNAYKLPAAATLLLPLQTRLPPAMSLALACGVDVLPGAASGFGIAGSPSTLAAASIDGGGMTSAALASGALPASATGSVVSIGNSMFACTMARLPYMHYAVAATQPFIMPAPVAVTAGAAGQPSFASTSAFGPSPASSAAAAALRFDVATSCADGSGNPSSAAVPMHSPAWIAALLCEGMGPAWSRVPVPLSPRLPSQSTASSSCLMADVAQVAFTAATWAGATVAAFFTAVLVPAMPLPSTTWSADAGSGARPVLGVWQVSVQLRCDDARVRAALAAEMPDFIAQASCGRFVTVTHGHAPAPTSLLQRLDVFIARSLEAVDPSVVVPGTSSSLSVAHAVAAASNRMGVGLLPLVAASASSELRSAGLAQAASSYNALGSSIFNVVPEDVLAAVVRSQIEMGMTMMPGGGEDGEGLDGDDALSEGSGGMPDAEAYAAMTAAGQVPLDDDDGGRVGGPSFGVAPTPPATAGGKPGEAMRFDDLF